MTLLQFWTYPLFAAKYSIAYSCKMITILQVLTKLKLQY